MAGRDPATGLYTPDPLSLLWERRAVQILELAYAARGRWFGTVIGDPTPAQAAYAMRVTGARIDGRDTATGRKAKTRWCRAFVRAVERMHRDLAVTEDPIVWQVGNRLEALGGRAFRIRLRTRSGADDYVRGLPDVRRIYVDAPGGGWEPGGRWAEPELRDWGIE